MGWVCTTNATTITPHSLSTNKDVTMANSNWAWTGTLVSCLSHPITISNTQHVCTYIIRLVSILHTSVCNTG